MRQVLLEAIARLVAAQGKSRNPDNKEQLHQAEVLVWKVYFDEFSPEFKPLANGHHGG